MAVKLFETSLSPFMNVVTELVFVVIMTSALVAFPVPQMQKGLDEREALECFILDNKQLLDEVFRDIQNYQG